MSDLELAKNTLKDKELALIIVKKGKIIFESKSHGLGSLLKAIERFGNVLVDSSVADRIVGKAAALLCAYSHVKAVFASVLSLEGKKTLEKSGIEHEFENLVQKILNRERKSICPFERLSLTITDPKEAYVKLRRLNEVLSRGGKVEENV